MLKGSMHQMRTMDKRKQSQLLPHEIEELDYIHDIQRKERVL